MHFLTITALLHKRLINIFFQLQMNNKNEKYPNDIIQAEFLTSTLMRSLITLQQRSENGSGF